MSSASLPVAKPARGLSIALWSVQVLLALAFVMAGVMKTTQPIEVLAANMPWVGYTPAPLVRFIGASEFLGAIGLILPAATRLAPFLTPTAGAALATVMVLAAGTHAVHAEFAALPINFVLGALAAFVAWGRFRGAPIAPRG